MADTFRVLIPSIVDPALDPGGAGAATRGFANLLQRPPLNAAVDYVPPQTALSKFHRLRQFAALSRSLFSSWPSKAAFTYSRASMRTIRRLLDQQRFDLVILNGSDLLWLLGGLPPDIPRLLLAHNIEHDLFLSQIESAPLAARLFGSAMRRDWRRLQRYEIEGLQRIKNVIFLSSHDAETAATHCPGLHALVVPPLFDYPVSQRIRAQAAPAQVEIGFMGNLQWWPNREGLRWFLKEVFPWVRENTRLHLFGNASRSIAPHPRLVSHGYVENVYDVWSACDFMICPIFSGGGAKVKMAEALYNRVPVLATSFAARGLPLNQDPSIVLLDRAEQWIEFLRSPELRTFSRCPVPSQIAGAFAVDAHVSRVHEFVRAVCRTSRLRGPCRSHSAHSVP